jgi:hypothetical protein
MDRNRQASHLHLALSEAPNVQFVINIVVAVETSSGIPQSTANAAATLATYGSSQSNVLPECSLLDRYAGGDGSTASCAVAF